MRNAEKRINALTHSRINLSTTVFPRLIQAKIPSGNFSLSFGINSIKQFFFTFGLQCPENVKHLRGKTASLIEGDENEGL
jgi:hypothetical protein